MTMDSSPLTEEHFQDIQRAHTALKAADEQVDRATRAGIATVEQKDKVKELRVSILKLRDAYFPGRTL